MDQAITYIYTTYTRRLDVVCNFCLVILDGVVWEPLFSILE